jgi:hypothetical protein
MNHMQLTFMKYIGQPKFGRNHYFPSYNILCDWWWGLYWNGKKILGFQKRSPQNSQFFQVMHRAIFEFIILTYQLLKQRGFVKAMIWGRLKMKSTCSLSVQIHKKSGNAFVWPCPSPTLTLLLSSCRLQTRSP